MASLKPDDLMTGDVALYSAVDDMLTHYIVDIDAATLTRRATVKVSAKVALESSPITTTWLHMRSPGTARFLLTASRSRCPVARCICAWIREADIR